MRNFFVIAGPCVIESEETCLEIAQELARISRKLKLKIIYKASFDKANRSDPESFRGLGIDEGLRILAKVKKETGLQVTTDIHEISQAFAVSDVCDVTQIPALLSRQNDLIDSVHDTCKKVNVKIGQFMSLTDVENLVSKIGSCDWLTYRGTSYGGKVLVDFELLEAIVDDFANTIIFDASHSVIDSSISEHMAAAALAIGVDGLFFEVHPDPEKALCDGCTSIRLDNFEGILKRLQRSN